MFEQDEKVKGGKLSYIHKVNNASNVYFVANSWNQAVNAWLRLRGRLAPESWDPHDGKIAKSEYEHVSSGNGPVTRVHLHFRLCIPYSWSR